MEKAPSVPSARLRRGYLLCLVLLSIVTFIAACSEPQSRVVAVVTQVVTVQSTDTVVTRVVRQLVEVTATPRPEGAAETRPVTLDISVGGRTPSLDPQLADDDHALDLVENLFGGLTNLNPATGAIEPELANRWETSADGRIWRFHLRNDVYWMRVTLDEGLGAAEQLRLVRPVTAADVVFAARRACDPASTALNVFLLFIIEGCESVHRNPAATAADLATVGVRAVDGTTVEFALNRRANHFLALTTLPLLRPLPPELVGSLGAEAFVQDDAMPDSLLTSGPFLLNPRSVKDSRLILFRNPAWPLPFAGNIETVTILYNGDSDAAYQQWADNRLDVAPAPDDIVAELQIRNPQRLVLMPSQAVFYLGFNFDSGIMRIPEVRRGLSASIDRQRLLDELYLGAGIPIRHLTPPGIIDAPPVDEVGVGYSPSFARQQIADSGFGDCRLMPPFRYMVSTSDLALRQAEIIRDMWIEELNCREDQIIIEQVRFGTLLSNTRRDAADRRPDVYDLAWESQYPDPENWLGDLLHCSDSENRPNRPCDQVDELIRRAADAAEPEQRATLIRQIETLFFAADGSYPIAPLYARGEYVLRQVWLDFTPASLGGEQFDRYEINEELKRFERSR